MAYSEEQRALRTAAERFAREKLAPRYQTREQEGRIDRALLREMGALGLIAGDLAESHGGLGLSSETTGLIMEALAYGDVNVAYVQLLGSLCGQIIARHATEDIAATWLPRIVSGESLVALALTEPRGGSDAANLALSARPIDTGYVLNGEKSSISIADQADAVLVFARTGSIEDRAHGISAFLVPMNAAGVATSRFTDLGSKAMGRGSIFFDDVQVPRTNRLGAEGAGFVQVMQGFDFSRALIGLQCIGPAQASLDESWVYASERHAFGGPLSRQSGRHVCARRMRGNGCGRAPTLLSYAASARRRPAAHRRGRDVQVARTEDRCRHYSSMFADPWSLWMVARPAASTAAAGRNGPRDRRWHRSDYEAHYRARNAQATRALVDKGRDGRHASGRTTP
jgi:cyclohexanecarboxyl-CoA dehydrogenase